MYICIKYVCVCLRLIIGYAMLIQCTSCLCRDWSSHASRTMSSIKTNVYGAALEYGLEDYKGVERCR